MKSLGSQFLKKKIESENCAGTPDHVGTVVEANEEAGYFMVVEGNYNKAVKKRKVSINGKYIRGFITPKYNDVTEAKPVNLHYRGYVQNKGWLPVQASGGTAGTTGRGLRLEAVKIDYKNHDVYAKAHIQDKGWVDYGKITASTVIGSTEQSKRLECLCLKGDFEWRAHIQGSGWTAWTKADGVATLGTVGKSLRMEAIEIREL